MELPTYTPTPVQVSVQYCSPVSRTAQIFQGDSIGRCFYQWFIWHECLENSLVGAVTNISAQSRSDGRGLANEDAHAPSGGAGK
jgi:hypothetical protein